jgi:hypothetical protein
MGDNVTLDLLGASSIARQVFGAATRRYRDLIPVLQEQGWPITEIDGRPAANSALLHKETVKRLTGSAKQVTNTA